MSFTYNGQVVTGQTAYDIAYANPGGLTANQPAGTPAQLSARAIIEQALAQWGLGSLASKAWGEYLAGQPMELVLSNIRRTPEYKTRFPYLDALAQKGRAISESEAIELERTYSQILRQAGLPSGFYDQPSDFAGWISGEVSPSEIQERLNIAQAEAADLITHPENSETFQALERLYGVKPTLGDITAFVLDEKRALPLVERQYRSARIAAAGTRSGYDVNREEAERLAAAGLTPEAAGEGLAALADSQELFAGQPGDSGADGVGRRQQIGALVGDADARRRIERNRSRQLAQFQGSSGYDPTSDGIRGLG